MRARAATRAIPDHLLQAIVAMLAPYRPGLTPAALQPALEQASAGAATAPRAMRTAEVARALGVSVQTVWRLRKAGKLTPCRTSQRRLLFSAKSVETLIEGIRQ